MEYITLKIKNNEIKISKEDFEKINGLNWSILKDKNNKYAHASINGKTVRMHRYIMNIPIGNKLEIDHINGDGLDNRRENLRIVTHQQNSFNKQKNRGKSKYKGVYWSKSCNKWAVQLRKNGKRVYSGVFKSEFDAGKAYNIEALKHFGEHAYLNILVKENNHV